MPADATAIPDGIEATRTPSTPGSDMTPPTAAVTGLSIVFLSSPPPHLPISNPTQRNEVTSREIARPRLSTIAASCPLHTHTAIHTLCWSMCFAGCPAVLVRCLCFRPPLMTDPLVFASVYSDHQNHQGVGRGGETLPVEGDKGRRRGWAKGVRGVFMEWVRKSGLKSLAPGAILKHASARVARATYWRSSSLLLCSQTRDSPRRSGTFADRYSRAVRVNRPTTTRLHACQRATACSGNDPNILRHPFSPPHTVPPVFRREFWEPDLRPQSALDRCLS